MLDICEPPAILPAERPLALCLHDDIAVLWYCGIDGAPSATICSPARGAHYIRMFLLLDYSEAEILTCLLTELEVVAPETNPAEMAHLDVDATEVEVGAVRQS